MKKLLVVGIAAAAFCGAPAVAADMPVKAPYTAPMFNWSGWYVGIEGGGGWGRTHVQDFLGNDTGTLKGSGGLVGGTVGFNFQNGPWILGVESDYAWANIDPKGNDAQVFPTCTLGGLGVCGGKLESFGTARARLGYAVDRVFVYATGGLGFGELQSFGSHPGSAPGSATHFNTGGTYGFGIEAALWQNWTAKIEYLHVELGDGPIAVWAADPRRADDWRANIVRVGLNYKFGDWGKSPVVAKY